MPTKPYLIVPLIVDALVQNQGSYVLDPLADFSLLPYVDGRPKDKGFREIAKEDVALDRFADTAYVSENIVAQPFGDRNFYLERGVHLHWALPQGLTIGRHPRKADGGPATFPFAPNRWLIVRSEDKRPTKTFLVESDYLDLTDAGKGIAYPLTPAQAAALAAALRLDPKLLRPYYRLGRQREILAGAPHLEDPEALTLARLQEGRSDGKLALTAMGWGDPFFHSFYPNCHSVFGFHDPQTPEPDATVVYSLTGWYSSSAIDPLAQTRTLDKDDGNSEPFAQADFESYFGWKIDDASWNELLKDALKSNKDTPGLICCGRVDVAPRRADGPVRHTTGSDTRIVFGNSGIEAIGAHVAREVAEMGGPQDQTMRVKEKQYACVTHLRALQDRQVDIEAQLQEESHSAGFTALTGGTLWTFREAPTPPSDDRKRVSKQAAELLGRLEDAIHQPLADQLHRLNQYQLAFDRGLDVIRSRRGQCYADWYKYMLCAYRPPEASRDEDYPAIDAVKRLLESGIVALDLTCRFVQKPADRKWNERLYASGFPGWLRGFLNNDTTNLPPGSGAVISAIADDVLPQGSALERLYAPEAVENKPPMRSLEETRDALKTGLDALLRGVCDVTRPATQFAQFPADIRSALEAVAAHVTSHPDEAGAVDAELANRRLRLQLLEVPAPRYWQPNEPTVLLAGEDATPGDRHDQNGPLWVFAATVNVEANNVPMSFSSKKSGGSPNAALHELAGELAAHPPKSVELKTRIWKSLEVDKETAKLTPADISALVEEYVARLNATSAEKDRIRLADQSQVAAYHRAHEREVNAWAGGEYAAWVQTSTTISRRSDGSHWHPLFLEWEVTVKPLAKMGNVPADRREYDPQFILSNFELAEVDVDLREKSGGRSEIISSSSRFSGRSILTPHAGRQMARNCETAMEWTEDHPAMPAKRANVDTLSATGSESTQAAPVGSPEVQAALGALQSLADMAISLLTGRAIGPSDTRLESSAPKEKPVPQTQSLSGFNDALLMHRQTLQLPIADPLGFEDYRFFTERIVKDAVDDQNLIAPEPWFDFHPLRTGRIHVEQLRLVDTFGQVRTVDLGSVPVDCTDQLRPVDVQLDAAHPIVPLPPRLTQPARVNFRWLSAADGAQETNAHAVTSPVCGWVVPNNLDTSLMIYDGQGVALGYIERTGKWRSAPGRAPPSEPGNIANPHLRRMVEWVVAQASSVARQRFMPDFIDVLDTALESIEPDNSAQHEALALLMGRPLALVRAFVNLELQGLPAIRQSWGDLRRRLHGEAPDDDGFRGVKIPFRLGEHHRLNDGVVGYWLEEPQGYRGGLFYAPQSDYVELPANEKLFIYREAGQPLNFAHSINKPPQYVSLLMDPRGLAHCTCGVLPTKSLSLPVEHTAGALRRIKVSFPSAPLLTDPGRVNIPLPTEPGFTWTWLQKDDQEWTELTTTPMVEKSALRKLFGADAGDAIWKKLIDDRKWIEPLSGSAGPSPSRARLVLPKPQGAPESPANVDVHAAVVRQILDAALRATSPQVAKSAFAPAFGENTDAVWRNLIKQKWIEPLPRSPDHANVVQPRPAGNLGPPPGIDPGKLHAAMILRALDASQRVLTDVSQEARFGLVQEIREGWLELTPATSGN